MKAYQIFAMTFLVLASLITVITGCKYDAAAPLWDKPPATTIAAIIDSVSPARATPGVNIITIYGKNFTGAYDTSTVHSFTGQDTSIVYNGVYFDKVPADIVEVSSTVLKVRRPNIATDSCAVQVTPDIALTGDKFGPYKIDPVLVQSSAYALNTELTIVVVDQDENFIVIERNSKNVSKVSPSGVKTKIDSLRTDVPMDAKISPLDNNLLYMTGKIPAGNKVIRRMNLTTGSVESWKTLPSTMSGQGARFCDFDKDGNFYTGGKTGGLIVVSTQGQVTTTKYYTNDEIFAIRVYDGYVYVASRLSSSISDPIKIWRHTVDASGTVGPQLPVLDMGTTGVFSGRLIRNISFSLDGTIYIGTNSTNPILVVTPQGVDYFYKGIIPTCSKYFSSWGNGTNLYLIAGDGTSANQYVVCKIDMGAKVGAR
jgi:hypothetical protein